MEAELIDIDFPDFEAEESAFDRLGVFGQHNVLAVFEIYKQVKELQKKMHAKANLFNETEIEALKELVIDYKEPNNG